MILRPLDGGIILEGMGNIRQDCRNLDLAD